MGKTGWSGLIFLLGIVCTLAGNQVRPDAAELEKKLATAGAREKLLLLNQLADPLVYPEQSTHKILLYARAATQIAREGQDRPAQAFALKNMAYGYYKMNNFRQALLCYFEARTAYGSIPDRIGIALINLEIGNILHYCLNDYHNAINYYEKALVQYKEANEVFGHAKCLNLLGEIHKKNGQYEKAVSCYIQALKTSEKEESVDLKRKRATILLNLSDISNLLEEYDQSLGYLQKAKAIFEQLANEVWIGGFLSRQGDIFRLQGKYQEALPYYFQALKIRKKGFNDQYVSVEIHKIAETYSLSGNFSLASKYFHQALNIRNQINDLLGQAQSLYGLGSNCRWQNRLDEALAYFEKSLALCRDNGYLSELKELYREMADLYARKGDLAKEVLYRRLFNETQARILSPKVSASIMRILLKYEKEKADEEIVSLQEKRKRIAGISLFAIGLLLLATFALILSRKKTHDWAKRSMLAQEKQLTEQNTQLNILKARLSELESSSGKVKYKKSNLTPEIAQVCLTRLIAAMEKDKLYQNSTLTLQNLAQKINVNRSYLSQVINTHTKKNFNDFINQFRIEDAKRLLAEKNVKDLSVIDVGFDVGFKSTSNFYRTFKKHTGLPPLEYQKRAQQR